MEVAQVLVQDLVDVLLRLGFAPGILGKAIPVFALFFFPSPNELALRNQQIQRERDRKYRIFLAKPVIAEHLDLRP